MYINVYSEALSRALTTLSILLFNILPKIKFIIKIISQFCCPSYVLYYKLCHRLQSRKLLDFLHAVQIIVELVTPFDNQL